MLNAAGVIMRQEPHVTRSHRIGLRTKAFLAAYFAVVVGTCVAIIIPALAHIQVLFAISLPDLMRGILYTFAAILILPALRSPFRFYRERWHLQPRRWWIWAIPLGLLLVPLGVGGSFVAALLHEHMPNAVGLTCFIGGFVVAFLGVGIWGSGTIRMALEMRRNRAYEG